MKKLIISAMFLLIISCLSSTIISIDNITLNRKLLDFDFYYGTLNKYNNRLIVDCAYKIEEYNIMSDGSLEKILSFDTKINYDQSSFIVNNKFYRYIKKNSQYYIQIFDLNFEPMELITTVMIPTPFFYRIYNFEIGDYILFTDAVNHRSYKLHKETNEIDGFIDDLYGIIASENDYLYWLKYRFNNQNEIEGINVEIYDTQHLENNEFGELVNVFELEGCPLNIFFMKVENNYFYCYGESFIYVFDVRDVQTPEQVIHLVENDEYMFIDVIYYNNQLYTSLTTGEIVLYSIVDNNYDVSFISNGNFDSQYLNNLSLNYPYLYRNNYYGVSVYDIDNAFSNIYNYFSYEELYDANLYKNYYFEHDENNHHYKIYPLYLSTEKFYEIPDNGMLYSMKQIDNYLYICRLDENQIAYFEMYSLSDTQSAELLISQHVEAFRDIEIINDYIYLVDHDMNYVYQIIDNLLVFYTSFNGIIGSYSHSMSYQNRDYIFVKNGNILEIRDSFHPDYILYSDNDNNLTYYLSIFENNYVSKYDFEQDVDFYRFDFNTFSIEHILSYSFDNDENYRNSGPYNGIFSKDACFADDSIIYNIVDGEINELGVFDASCLTVSHSRFFPEYNTAIFRAGSGFYLYDIEYTVSSSDQVVEINRDTYVYPNPVNGGDVNFKTALSGNDTEISIYNIKGQLVKTSKAFQTKDNESIFTWDKRNNQNQSVASGVYFYKIKTDTQIKTGKFLIMK
jgi:hypothetical protein